MARMHVKPEELKSWKIRVARLEEKSGESLKEIIGASDTTAGRLRRGEGISEIYYYRVFRRIFDGVGDSEERNHTRAQTMMKSLCEYDEAPPVPEAAAPARAARKPTPRGDAGRIACITLYSACLHLRPIREDGRGWAYLKAVPGSQEPMPVFTEFLAVRSYLFPRLQEEMNMEANSAGLATLLPVFPPRLRCTDNRVEGVDRFHTARHTEDEAGAFYQAGLGYINGFFPDTEIVGLRITHNCDRAVLVVDFNFLPCDLVRNLFLEEPTALYSRENEEERQKLKLDCRSEGGVFIVDTKRAGKKTSVVAAWNPNGETIDAWNPAEHRVRKSGRIQIHFSVNWPAVAEAYPVT